MIELRPLESAEHSKLYELALRAEPFRSGMTLEEFKLVMVAREGWTIWDGARLIGCVSLSDFQPGLSIMLHGFVDPEYHGRWMNRRVIREIFSLVFIDLNLPKLCAFSIKGKSDSVALMLEHLGFSREGEHPCAVKLSDGFHTVISYGMLRGDCRWL